MELERKMSVLQHTKGFKTMRGKPTVKWTTKRKEEKRHRKKTGRHWREIRRKAGALSHKPKRNMSRSSKASRVQKS